MINITIKKGSLKILFYTPLNTRCRDIESQAVEFKKKGHEIFLLTQSGYNGIHENFKSYGFTVAAKNAKSPIIKILILKRLYHLIKYCWKHKIDVVYSHLEPSNFIAVLAQYFVKARVIICRHHVNEAQLYPFGQDLSYKLTYKLAKEIVVVSNRAKAYMVAEENVPAHRIHQINLAYDFKLYNTANPINAEKIRNAYSGDLLLLAVCRLTKYKRPKLAIRVVKNLVDSGINAKLIILGKGELMDDLRALINELGLQEHVYLAGYVNNVLDYMAAADLFIHPSLLESSCISLKEAALVNLPSVVCSGIGDFDEVIKNRENGFIVDQDNFIDETVAIIKEFRNDHEALNAIGKQIEHTVRERFEIKNVVDYYERTFHNAQN